MFARRVLGLLASLICTVSTASYARAYDGATGTPNPSVSAGPTVPASAALSDPLAPQPKKRAPMNGYAFGVTLGIAHVGSGDMRNPTYVAGAETLSQAQLQQAGLIGQGGCDPIDKRCRTQSRTGLQLSVPIQLGGSGVGFRVEPFFTFASSAKAYGLYMGPTFEFQVARAPVYLGFGFGLKAAWVKADDWKYAADLYGRIPAHATYYMTDDVALVLEFAFGAGASGYGTGPRKVTLPGTTRTLQKSDFTFGFGRTWDISIGVRFP